MRENFLQGLHLIKGQTELLFIGIAMIALGLALVVFEVARGARDD